MNERHPAAGPVGTDPRPAVPNPTTPPSPLLWERYFPSLAPDVQHHLLQRAAACHGLSVADLPAHPPAAVGLDRVLSWLAPRHQGELPRFDPVALANDHRPLDEVRAVAVALACPDLFLLQAETHADQYHLATEVAWEAAQAGERVLIVTPTPADADAAVARLAKRCEFPVGRALAPHEHADRLPPTSASRTAHAHGDAALTSARTESRKHLTQLDARLSALRAVQDSLPALRTAADEWTRGSHLLGELQRERDHLPAALAGEAGGVGDTPFADRMRPLAEAHAATLKQLHDDVEKNRLDREAWTAARTEARSHLDSLTQQPSPKSGGFFAKITRLFHAEDGADKLAQAAARVKDAEATLERLDAEHLRLTADLAAAVEGHRSTRDANLAEETPRRLAALDQRIHELRDRLDHLGRELDVGREAALAVGCDPFDTPTAENLDRAAAQLAALVGTADAEQGFAKRWVAELDARSSDLAGRLLGLVRVTAAPFAAIGHDPLTRADAPDAPPLYDRLVVTDADRMDEAEFAAIARIATRWLLIGDAGGWTAGRPCPHRPAPRPRMFHRFWQRLHHESWTRHGGRLTAHLAFVDTPDRWVEPVADQPDVEVWFARRPDEDPVVTDVTFPPRMSAVDAARFLAAELGDVPVRMCGAQRWHETETGCAVCWPHVERLDAESDWVEPAPGVRQRVVVVGDLVLTAALQFDTSHGWDREAAARWVADRSASPRTASFMRQAPAVELHSAHQLVGAIG